MSAPRKRRWVAWTGAVVLVLMFLLPPWVNTIEGRPTGDTFYAEILPGPRPPHCAAKVVCGVKVDMVRLGLQLAAWGVVFVVPWVIARRRSRQKPNGSA